jgi:hypothetical protein
MVRNRWLLLAIALFTTSAFARDLPDKTRTPGVANPAVTQDNIDQTICVSGWTATIRPSSSYTSKLKIEQIKEYRYKDKKPGDYKTYVNREGCPPLEDEQ